MSRRQLKEGSFFDRQVRRATTQAQVEQTPPAERKSYVPNRVAPTQGASDYVPTYEPTDLTDFVNVDGAAKSPVNLGKSDNPQAQQPAPQPAPTVKSASDSQVEQLKIQNELLEGINDGLQRQLDQANGELTRLRPLKDEVEALRAAKANAENRAQAEKEAADKARAAQQNVESRADKAEKAVEELRRKLTWAEDEADCAGRAFKEVEAERDELKNKLASVEADLAAAQRRIAELEARPRPENSDEDLARRVAALEADMERAMKVVREYEEWQSQDDATDPFEV